MRAATSATWACISFVIASSGYAKSADHDRAEAQALDLAKQAIALRSVRGPGNQAPQVAALFKSALVAGGFNDADVTITPVDDTAYLIARWKGRDPKLKPLVISGHMDVVEAKPADWERDPFTPVVENGLLYGRGASDMKLDDALAVAALIELKRQGYQPRRDLVLAFSGDEETAMKTTRDARQGARERRDGPERRRHGRAAEPAGKPEYFSWSGGRKDLCRLRADRDLTRRPSSRPYDPNAINQLAAALVRIGQYKFKPELSDLTRAYFKSAADYERRRPRRPCAPSRRIRPMRRPLPCCARIPATIGKIGTTCVVTMINGGHAQNALPQRATANINCRIFPGHPRAEIMEELQRVAADPAVQFKDVSTGSVATDASPIRADLVAAVTKAIHLGYPGVPVFPTMSAGASDSMWFRNEHIPSYGVSPLFMKDSDRFSHGLNERVPVGDIQPSIAYMFSLFTDLSK